MDIWEPTIGETLLAKMEPSNIKDRKAVAVIKDGETVGHVPLNLASKLFQFLRRDINEAFVEVTGAKVNRGAGYGLEIPCIYRLYGPSIYINRMKELVDTLVAAGHL